MHLDMMQFFKDGGSFVISVSECLIYDVEFKDFSKNCLPPFSTSFKEIIQELYRASFKDTRTKKRVFEKFRTLFGDYLSTRVQTGMQVSYTKLIPPTAQIKTSYTVWKPTAAPLLERRYIKNCNHRWIARGLKLNISKHYENKMKCPLTTKRIAGKSFKYVTGGPFDAMKNMWNSEIWGNPVRFTLAPITDLFNDKLFAENAIHVAGAVGKIVPTSSINQWFLPLFLDKVKDYRVSNNCPDGYKLYGNFEKHTCQGKEKRFYFYFHSVFFTIF